MADPTPTNPAAEQLGKKLGDQITPAIDGWLSQYHAWLAKQSPMVQSVAIFVQAVLGAIVAILSSRYLAAVVLAVVMLGVAHAAEKKDRSCGCPCCKQPAPKVVQQAAPTPKSVEGPLGLFSGELRKRILFDVLRHHAVERAVRDGVVGPDGKVRKVTRDEAKKLAEAVKDEHIIGMAAEKGAPGVEKGAVVGEGGKLQAFLQWLWDHKEEIIKFILAIMALFGDPVSLEFWALPDGNVVVVAAYPGFVVMQVL